MRRVCPEKFGGVENNSTEELVALLDIAPTLLDYAGLQAPEIMDGSSLRPIIDKKPVDWRDTIFLENLYTGQNYPRVEAVRDHRYKYIRYFDKAREVDYQTSLKASYNGEPPVYEEFYDLQSDPSEETNLIAAPEFDDLIDEYRNRNKKLLSKALEPKSKD